MNEPLTKWDAKIKFASEAYQNGWVSKEAYFNALAEIRFEKRMEQKDFMNEQKQAAFNIN